MSKLNGRVAWYVVAWRLPWYAIAVVLLSILTGIIFCGWGKDTAVRFWRDAR